MTPEPDEVVTTGLGEWRAGISLLERLFALTEPGAIFGEAISAQGRTIIPAAEVIIGLGFGYGAGSVAGPSSTGGGGGGGGGTLGRPVALIVLDEQGVRVEPVVDAMA